jgi:hypothetical protein
MTRRAMTSAAIGTAVFCTTQLARSGDGDADAQFKYGLAEMLAGRYATGCPAIETSYRLDPRAGTLFTLAECHRKAGKTASALAGYQQYLAVYGQMTPEQKAAQKERAAVATEERAALEPAVPRLIIELPQTATPGMIVQRDGATIGGAMMGAALPVDPGEHIVRTVTPDGQQHETRVVLADGEQRTVIAELPAPQAPNERPAASAPTAAPGAEVGSRRAWTYSVGAVGVVGLVVAGTTGALAIAKGSTASNDCNASGVCATQQGVDAGNAARSLANVATVGCVVGGIALAAAIVLWLTEPSAKQGNVAMLAGTW